MQTINKKGWRYAKLHDQHNDIGLVFMDIKMPIMNGIEARNLIKSEHPDSIVIAQSAYTNERTIGAALEAGCTEFISKPIDRIALMELIRQFMNG